MNNHDLIKLYLESNSDDLELSIGRVLAASNDETYRAGTDEVDKIRELVEAYYERNKTRFKEIICKKLKLDQTLAGDKFNHNLEGAVLIAEILEQSDFIPMPLTYPLLSVWLMKKKIYELCE